MQDLKPYLVPGIALVVLGLWFFVVQPRLTGSSDQAAPSPTGAKSDSAAASGSATTGG